MLNLLVYFMNSTLFHSVHIECHRGRSSTRNTEDKQTRWNCAHHFQKSLSSWYFWYSSAFSIVTSKCVTLMWKFSLYKMRLWELLIRTVRISQNRKAEALCWKEFFASHIRGSRSRSRYKCLLRIFMMPDFAVIAERKWEIQEIGSCIPIVQRH